MTVNKGNYQFLFEKSNYAILIQKNGHILDVNPKACELLGYENGQLTGMDLHSLLEADDKLVKMWIKGEFDFFEARFRKSDGTFIDFEINSCPVDGDDSSVIGFIMKDITEHKRADDTLKDNFIFIEKLLDTIPSPIFYKNLKNIYIGCNKAFAKEIIGLPREQIIGKNLYDFPDSIPLDTASVYHKFDMELILKEGKQSYEGTVRKSDGSAGDYVFNKATLTGSDGKTIGIAGVMLEVTGYKRAVQSLVEKTALLGGLLDSVPEMVFFKDMNGNYLGCNPVFSEYVGLPIEKIIGRNDFELFDEETAYLFREMDRFAVQQGSSRKNEEWVEYPDGSKVLLETFKAPLKLPDGNVIGSLGVSRDITARKRSEELLLEAKIAADVANRTKNEFLVNMSHEVRTPLNSIIGFSDLLLDGGVEGWSKEQIRYMGRISESSKQLLRVINSILDISKIESAEVELYYENVNIIELVNEVVDILEPLARQKEISIFVEDISETKKCEVGKNQISQVLYNLIGNAILFTLQEGSIRISIEDNGGFLRVSVSDTGMGIPPESMDEIFLPFTQFESERNIPFWGTGFGLSLVKEFVEMHGGTITVTSRLGEGTVFSFTLPINMVADSGKTPKNL